MDNHDDKQGIDAAPASLPQRVQRYPLELAPALARLLKHVAKEVAREYVRLLEMDRREPRRHSKRAQRSGARHCVVPPAPKRENTNATKCGGPQEG